MIKVAINKHNLHYTRMTYKQGHIYVYRNPDKVISFMKPFVVVTQRDSGWNRPYDLFIVWNSACLFILNIKMQRARKSMSLSKY